ncbi:replication-associated recombination protein A [Tumebacillus sp. ITR2]|uniref:Replication-associated recombination protein A n=1 Tax=Tumebacillus amylolyticus TaxID=2801339 RepID=A0ABS1JAV7_9BACL|nr:replication-associated recombination protein A [Tumebacillus amylolyticus]MBL0387375.1 replication-associated recombination protein A [Tumebacillus amylolyticus]
MDLFGFQAESEQQHNAPLAARMRPQSLDELIGQENIVGRGKLLRRAIETDSLTSLILYGPPGTGKTTIARVIAGSTKRTFRTLNAVTAGVADIRKVVDDAKDARSMYQQRTVLFVDEIHRFNKSQQDALLPHVEEGLIVLIGATTENPFFEVNAALLSRSQIFQLQKHTEQDLTQMAKKALSLPGRGLGNYNVSADDEALQHLARYADGDARRLYNALELAVLSTPPDEAGVIHLTLDVAAESIQRRVVRYDKSSDQHYDTTSALIKSIRGSDPDAALYWMAKMIDAGEDPKFIGRRLIISASEDIGNADPRALQIALSAFQAVEVIGMPEGRIILGQAVTYLATAPKSNAAYNGINAALQMIREGSSVEVPPHLRDAHYKGASKLGHGQGYLYPHNFPGNYVEQPYLPEELHGTTFYHPTRNGYEQVLAERLRQWRGERNGG